MRDYVLFLNILKLQQFVHLRRKCQKAVNMDVAELSSEPQANIYSWRNWIFQ